MLSLIVNPSAGGGRAGKVLPDVQAGLSALGSSTTSSEPAASSTRASSHRAAAGNGEIAAALGGDGLIGAVAGALKDARRRPRRAARRPRQRFRPRARDPAGASRSLRGARARRNPPARPRAGRRAARSSASRAAALTPTPTGSPTRHGWSAGTSSTPTARCARWPAGGRPASRYGSTAARLTCVTGYTVAAANSKAYGGGMFLAPDASLEDGLLDVVIVGEVPKLRFLRLLPTVFKGEHVRQPNVEVLRGAGGGDQRRPPVHDVCRRRSDRRAAGDRARAAGRGARDGARGVDAIRDERARTPRSPPRARSASWRGAPGAAAARACRARC